MERTNVMTATMAPTEHRWETGDRATAHGAEAWERLKTDGKTACGVQAPCQDAGHTCTRPQGHNGMHVVMRDEVRLIDAWGAVTDTGTEPVPVAAQPIVWQVGDTPETHGREAWNTVHSPAGGYCYDRSPDRQWMCTRPTGHPEWQHVGCTVGRVVGVWGVPPTGEADGEPVSELDQLKALVRSEAVRQIGLGYGRWDTWQAAFRRIGLEPLRKQTVKVKVDAQLEAELSGYTEARAREWVLSNSRESIIRYLTRTSTGGGWSPQVVSVDEEVEPAEALSWFTRDSRADTDDVDTFRELLRDVALDMKEHHGWCDSGTNEVLERFGCRPVDDDLADYTVTVNVTLSVSVSIPVSDMVSADHAQEYVEENYSSSDIKDLVRSQYGMRDLDVDEWEVESVEAD